MSDNFKGFIVDTLKSVVIGVGIAICLTRVVQPTIVSGNSMYPTIDDRDCLLINKLAYKKKLPVKGDIIIFNTNMVDEENGGRKILIKRVIGLPGDTVIVEGNAVFVNGEMLEESYLGDSIVTEGDISMVVPEDSVFVLGDNRGNSADSRQPNIGAVSMGRVIGEAVLRVYPFDSLGSLY